MKIDNLSIGEVFLPTQGKPEGIYVDIDASGILLVYNFLRPTQTEIDQMGAGKPFEIRFVCVKDALYILTKCGDLNWTDAPYNPHLSSQLELQQITNDSEGYALTLLMVDAATSIIKSIRLIGLGNKFSKALKNEIDNLLDRPFLPEQYVQALQANTIMFSTKDLVRRATNYWKRK